jgi:hypothetical protein
MLQFPPISLLKIDGNFDLRKGQSRLFILSMTEALSLRSISGNGPPLARHSGSMTHDVRSLVPFFMNELSVFFRFVDL